MRTHTHIVNQMILLIPWREREGERERLAAPGDLGNRQKVQMFPSSRTSPRRPNHMPVQAVRNYEPVIESVIPLGEIKYIFYNSIFARN